MANGSLRSPFLLDILETYWPDATYDFETYPEHEAFGGAERGDFDEYPHVSHVLATVTGKQLVRTRPGNGVAAIPALLLRSLGSIDRGHYPDSSEHWETLYPEFDEAGFDWGPGVRDQLRTVVEDCGLARQLPDECTFADVVT